MHQGRACALLATLFLFAAGCQQDATVARVDGVVRLDGKPLTTGTVRFVPEAGRAATGEIQSDGTYTLGTYGKSDGALIGRHKVAIIAYEGSGEGPPPYEAASKKSKPLVPERYMAVGTSQLSFEVKPSDNQADFDLRSGR
jgi:hypothetical protein